MDTGSLTRTVLAFVPHPREGCTNVLLSSHKHNQTTQQSFRIISFLFTMAPNVQQLSFLIQTPVSLSTSLKAAPVARDYTAEKPAESADYWAWESPSARQHQDIFSSNHIVANLSRAASSLADSKEESSSQAAAPYWDEADYKSEEGSYWNDERATQTASDNYWY